MTSGPRWNPEGLVPAVVQDADTRRVLMLGYMNAEALDRTRTSGEVWFWSRSRSELWHKGETSGNRLEVVDLSWDCDTDALLVRVHPRGPTCHTGSVSCFGTADEEPDQGTARLEELWRVVTARRRSMPSGSYTVALLADEPDATGRKLVEEATETLLAAKDHAAGAAPDRRLAEEAADLIYHLWVLLAGRGVQLRDVLDVLDARAGRTHGETDDAETNTVTSEEHRP